LGFVFHSNRALTPESRRPNVAIAALPASRSGAVEVSDTSGAGDRTTAQAQPASPINAVYFRITSLGIDPAELSLPAGRYFVAIDNDSGFNAVDLKIDKEGGPRLGTAQLPSGKRKWRGYVEFTPGKHIFSDPNDVKRIVHLIITDK